MTEGDYKKDIIFFAIPVFIGALFQQMYNTVDSLIVGNYLGPDALAAVSSTGSLTFLLVGFFWGFSNGAGVIVARFIGARNEDRTFHAVHTAMGVGLVCGALMTVLGVIISPILLRIMQTPQSVYVEAKTYLTIYFAGSFFLVRYVHKLRKQSPLPASDAAELEAPQSEELTTRRLIALIAFIIGFVVLVYGATHGWSTADAIPAVFMVTAVVCGLICGFKPSEIATEFVNGAKTMAGAALVVAFATGINTILSSGNIIHTIVHAMAQLFSGGSTFISAIGMYISNLIINCVLCSSSSQATTVIPIFSGVGEVLGLTQQTVVQTFNFGDAFTNLITPVSSVLMASIGYAGISLDRWLKFAWKWLLVFILIGAAFIILGTVIHYGPF